VGRADAVEASEAYRAWPLLPDSVRVGVGAVRSRDSLRRTPSLARLVCSQSRAATLFRPCCGRACELLVGLAAVLCERWGRSEGLACGCTRRVDVADDMAEVWAQGADAGVRCGPAHWVSRAGATATREEGTQGTR
jgi:hypothetical protein